MKYRLLGRSELRISVTGFGCMSLQEGTSESARVIDRAIEAGINFFDTADLYERGLNEERIGKILKGKREQVVMATKVGNRWREDGSGWDWTPRKEYILRAAEASLKRLGTDRIDLYQLHGGTIEDPMEEVIEAFELLQQQGKILFYGLSSIRPNVIREYVRRSAIASVMMQYSLADRRPEECCLKELSAAGIGVLARGVVMKGTLAGKEVEPYLGHSAAEMEAAAVRTVADGGNARDAGVMSGGADAEGAVRGSPSEIAIRWVLENPAVSCAVVGIRTAVQLEEAIAAGEGDGLTGEEVQLLGAALKEERYELHR